MVCCTVQRFHLSLDVIVIISEAPRYLTLSENVHVHHFENHSMVQVLYKYIMMYLFHLRGVSQFAI